MVLPIVVVVAGVVLNSWFSLRKLATREKFRTSRFTEALKDTSPRQRPEIIRALGCLEEGGDDGTVSDSDPTGQENRATVGGLYQLGRQTASTENN